MIEEIAAHPAPPRLGGDGRPADVAVLTGGFARDELRDAGAVAIHDALHDLIGRWGSRL